jgi:hypothetical protein
MIELPAFPTFLAPKTPDLPAPVLELPRAVLPSYTPVVIPPAATAGTPPVPLLQTAKPAEPAPETQQNLRQLVKEALRQAQAKPSVRRVEASAQAIPEPLAAEVTEIVVPGTSIAVPVPKAEILSAAATTSVISVGATLAATSMFKRLVQVFKPTFKALAAKVQKLRGKPVRTWARQRLSERHRRRVAHRVNRRGF